MMKTASALVMVLLCGGHLLAAGQDDASVVSWSNIAGVITAPGIDNPVAIITDQSNNVLSQIHSGTLPWVVRTGAAAVDLTTGAAAFSVRGLVLIGGNASGTPGPINQVVGTLVCNPGSTDVNQPQSIVDTPPVALTALGNADFSGELIVPPIFPCGGPLFLIRIGPAFGGFAGRWLATGVGPQIGRSHPSGNKHDSDQN